MLGFAVVDRQANASKVAVWLTSRVDAKTVQHTNAVLVDLEGDSQGLKKVFNLTRERAVLTTENSRVDDLGLTEPTISLINVHQLAIETNTQQREILAAIDVYAKETRNKNLKRPEFPFKSEYNPKPDESEVKRTLRLANYLAEIWSAWLATEHERVRRTTQPGTGKTPWMMPAQMNSPQISEFPQAFGERLPIQRLRSESA